MHRFQFAWTILIVFVAIMGTSLLSMKTAGRYDRIQALKSQIKSDKEAIVLLGNELTVLASPERLKRLVDEHALQLQAPSAEQILVAANDLSPAAGTPLPQLAQAQPQMQVRHNNNVPYVISLQKSAPAPQQFADRALQKQPNVMMASSTAKTRGPLVSFTEAEPALTLPTLQTNIDAPRDGVITAAYSTGHSLPPRAGKAAETSGQNIKIKSEVSVATKSVLPKLEKKSAQEIAPKKPKTPRIEIAQIQLEEKSSAPKLPAKKPDVKKPDVKKPEAKVADPEQKSGGLSSGLINQIHAEAAREQRQ